ncbi:MAG: Gx transporter family protein [Clostridium sp.]|nr:Gx transporter family protein [Acetatifactor muris]MCM1528076.1 Gx transporter family protein [Bacteroides sp.]MCM1564288.1 Gx transporter family protein [Clostridium sp.]
MSTKKLTYMSLLLAAALILYVIELRLPGPVPIPGVKLGLANIITVLALYRLKPSEAALIVIARVILGAIFAGSMSAFLFSACGAVVCLCGMIPFVRAMSGQPRYIPLCSVLGAMLHNAGQMAAAFWILRSVGVLAYLPILMVAGGIAGLFTGICAREVERRLP